MSQSRNIVGLWLLSASLTAQSPIGEIPLADANPRPDYSFGMTLDPDGRHAYVAVCGNYGLTSQNNRRLVKVDLRTRSVVAETQVGYFPEDIVVLRDASGNTRHILVTCSSSSEVRILGPNLQLLQLVVFGLCPPFSSVFPFGLAASLDERRVLVTTLGGCGHTFLLDTDPASPAFGTVIGTLIIPDGHARPCALPNGDFVIPSATYLPGGLGSTALALRVSTAPTLALQITSPLLPPQNGLYATGADCALLPNGNVLMLVAGTLPPMLLELDPTGLLPLRSIPLGPNSGSNVHGLGVDPTGRLAVVAALDADRVLFVDLPHAAVLAAVPTGAGSNPNDILWSPDRRSVWATLQGQSRVLEIGRFPWLNESLRVRLVPPFCQVTLAGLESAAPFHLGISLAVTTPGHYGLALADPWFPLATGTADVYGFANLQFDAPAPGLNLDVYLQAATIDRNLAVSTTTAVTLRLP